MAPPSRVAFPTATAGDTTAWRVALGAIVATALGARLIGLNSGLWIDEIYSLVRSVRAPLGAILTEFWGDNHHPFYALLAHVSRATFGEAPWAIRLPALLFGVAAVPMLYALGVLVASRREALLSALLLAVSYHHVWFSQSARGYSAVALVAIVTMWALLRGVATGGTRYFVVYGIVAGLGAYTHLTTVFVVVGHALALLWFLAFSRETIDRGAAVRGGLLAFATGATVTVVLYAPMLSDVVEYFLNKPSGLRGVSTPRWALLETIRVLVLGLGAGMALLGGVIVAVGAFVGVSGIVAVWKQHRLFVLMLVGSSLVTVAGTAVARGTMYPRFFFFAIGPAIVLVVRGAYAACDWLARVSGRPILGGQLATGGVAAVALLSAASLGFNYRYPKQDFEGAMRFVLAEQRAGDAVVSTGLPADPYRMLYGQPWSNLTTRAELDSVRHQSERTWVLWTFPRYLERFAPEIDQVLRADCGERRTFKGTLGGGDVLVCALPTLRQTGPSTSRVSATVSAPSP
jgi:4-amino-4-deoxy-L-arabinose transferase-like glycosyltransferase